MRLPNREGTPVDPVPFVVVAALGGLVSLSFGPPYLMEHGLSLEVAVAASVALTVAVGVVAYHRYVWRELPAAREEVPAAWRYRRLVGWVGCGMLVLLALVGLLYV